MHTQLRGGDEFAEERPVPVVAQGRRAQQTREIAEFIKADSQTRGASTLIISGPAGIGKSWTIEQVLSDLLRSPEPHLILRARGHISETEFHFAGLSQLLRPVLIKANELPAPERMALRSAVSGADFTTEGTDRLHRVAVGTLALLEHLCAFQPVVLLVDNAQWLDPPTRRILTYISRRLDGQPVTVVIATREATLAQHVEARHVPLQYLSDEAARDLVRQVAPHLPANAIEHVVVSAGGMPLALVEIPQLPDLAERLAASENFLPGDVLDLLPPGTTLLENFRERISWMSTLELRAAMVIALEDLALTQITAVYERIGAELIDLAAAEHAGLIEWTNGAPRIAHSTVRGALHELVPGTDQIIVRQAIAAVLSDDPARAAKHLVALIENTAPEVAETLAEAATLASERGEHFEAGRLWELAARRTQLASYEAKKRRFEAAVEANVTAGSQIAAARCAQALWNFAVEHDDIAARVSAHTHWLEINYAAGLPLTSLPDSIHGKTVDAVAPLIDAAVAAASQAPDEVARLLTMLMNVLRARGRAQDAHLVVNTFKEHVPAGVSGLESELLIENILRGTTEAPPDQDLLFGPWIDILNDDALLRFFRTADSLILTMIWSDVAGVKDLIARFQELVTYRNLISSAAKAAYWRAVVAHRDGLWDEALELYAEAERALLATDFRGSEIPILLMEAWLTAQQGDAGATRLLMQRAGQASHVKPPGFTALAQAIDGMLAYSRGDCERAVTSFKRSARNWGYFGFSHPVVPATIVAQIEALWRLRRDDTAKDYLAYFEKHAILKHSHRHQALALRCRALFEADFGPLFERAVAKHDKCRRTRAVAEDRDYDLARTNLMWGMRLRRVRRKHDAGKKLHGALAIFTKLNAEPWADLARAELKACGERHVESPDLPDHLKNLTPREYEIAMAAAEGLKNVDIAARLTISPRTVEQHLSAVFQKLGIKRRTELAQIMPKPG